jgi:lipoprotein
MKKLFSILLASLFAVSFAACSKSEYRPDAVVLYIEYNGVTGKEDDKVKAALEEKFKKDTGESIDLILEPASTDSIGNKVVGAISTSSDRIDGLIHHYSSDSMITQMITEKKELKDLTGLAAENAPDFLSRFNAETDPDGLAYRKGMFDGKLYALSSLEHNSIYGMLINRGFMENTSFDPDEYDISKEGYKSLTLDEFTRLLSELKENNTEVTRPLVGAPYDLDYFLAPVYGTTGYTRMEREGDKLYPAYAKENYLKVLEYERMLQEEKLWVEKPIEISDGVKYFTSGKSAVYVGWPEVTSQIQIAKKLKLARNEDCIMVAPLLKEGSTTETNGNLRQTSAFLGLMVPKKGQNTELLLKFVNWLHKDKENYELAKYGIKGEHWVETQVDGKEAYAYPEEKRAEYEALAPYSGLYCLLTDVHISDRIYAGYTGQETKWVEEVRAFKTFPEGGYIDEGMNIPSVPATDRALKTEASALGREYVSMRAYAWSDAPIPSGETLASLHAKLRENLTTKYKNYIQFLTDEYNAIVASYQSL